jgi:predicted RND superfamily exporter protein
MSFARSVAHFVTHRQRSTYAVAIAILLACGSVLAFFLRLDTEILNLLPAGFDSVETLKSYSRDFTPSRELTFAVWDETHTADLDGFAQHFGEELRKEPWVERVLDSSPMESPAGLEDLRKMAVPLLLNLPAADFAAALELLRSENIQTRLKRLRTEVESSSPRAEIELGFDPLGIITRAMKPLASSFSAEQSQPLASADGTLRLIMAMTNQQKLGPRDCQALMRRVHEFEQRVARDWAGPAPQILVTGRTPYVAEMSRSMEKDIASTLLGSVILVSLVFFVGFHRVRPLLAILHVLLLCCVIAVAFGAVAFPALNGITIGFCSILVGLGVDFGMLLYGAYQAERRQGTDHEAAIASSIKQLGKGIFFGALTTAAGFLSLALSGCAGFAQLGVLIAVGILFAALFMLTFFFAWAGRVTLSPREDWLVRAARNYVGAVFLNAKKILVASTALLLLLCGVAVLPVGQIHFEANPRSLEPADSAAGFALRKIQEKMSHGGIEQGLVLVEAPDARSFHDQWSRLQIHWTDLVARGDLKSVNSPAAFVLSPARIIENASHIRAVDFSSARSTLDATIETEGFNRDSFTAAYELLANLEKSATHPPPLDWLQILPADSSWRFIFDKLFAPRGNVAAAYITPAHAITNSAERDQLRDLLAVPGVPIHISGWSFILADLAPWSHHKLIELSVVMIGFNIVLLLFLYRRFSTLFTLMLSLVLSIGAMVASVKMFHLSLNLFNVLAFPLVLGVGVDYGIYMLLALQNPGEREQAFATILKPVLLSGLTTIAGFGSLAFAQNPSLSGLGILCAIGIGWSLFSTIFFILPIYVWRGVK